MKKKAEHRILFDSSGCLTQQAIALFVDGKLSDAELRKLKKHASDCALCADALEGAIHFKSGSSFNARIEQMHNSKWRRSQDAGSKSRRLFYGISSAAASVILLFGIYFILRMDRLAKQEFDLLDNKEIALSESEFNEQPAKKQNIPEQIPASEASRLKKQKIEKQIKEDIKTIDEPAEILSDAAFESDVEFDEDFETANEESMDLELEKELDEEEAMRVAYSANASTDIESEITVAAPMTREKGEKPIEEKVERADKKSFMRKNRSDKASEAEAYYIAEVTPMFQGGGVEKFNRYLADSLRIIIPDSVLVESIIISFVVDTSGYINKVKLVSGTSSDELNDSIIEFVKSSPVWIPGYAAGKVVEYEQQMEIVFDTNTNQIQ